MNCTPSHLCHSWHQCLLLIVIILCTASQLQWIHCQSCGPKVSPRLLREIPCDMNSISFCTQPGNAYPWSAVRRYIFENQGFMKRMYGENRQSQVVREEIARMNDRYDVLDISTFRSAKSDSLSGTVNENDLNERTASTNIEKDIEFGQTTSMLLNDTASMMTNSSRSSISSRESENATISVSEAEPEANQFTTISTAGENLTKSGAEESVDVEVREDNTPTTPVVDIDNAVVSDEAPEKPTKGYNACPITQEVVAPYWANNTRGQTLALLNVYPFEQYIHWEKCAFEGEQMNCREGCRCEQQYRLHRLLAFDPKNECRGIFADWFRFPGCCVCICYDNHERINNRKARL